MSKGDDQPSRHGLIDWFAHNHVAANILMALLLVGGFISVTGMRTETFPSIDPKLVTVSVPYPGATPYEVSDGVTSRVEEALIGIEGVKRITSTAAEGLGLVYVELEDFANADDVYNDVETEVNSLSDFPPEDAERPVVKKVKLTPNVISLALHGDVPERTIKFWAETIEDDLRQLPGVAKTSLRGIRDFQISIEVPERSLRQYELSLQDVEDAVRRFSADVPAGMIESVQGDVLLRVQEKKYTGEQFEEIVIRTLADGSSLTLGDVGKIHDGFEDINLISRFNGEAAAFIDVSRSDTGDTLRVARHVKDYLKTVSLPKDLKLSLQEDETAVLSDRINLMLRNGVLGFMLVFLILLLFLDLKLAFWTSVAIPVSFLGGLMVIHFMGFSLNMVSIFALIVVLGVVVDDAIIVGESIFEMQENDNSDPDAFLRGVYSVLGPVTIGVMTTMAAFAPLIFSTGVLGQIIMVIPIVVIPILGISLLEAYFILPAHLSNPTRWSKGIVRDIRQQFSKGLKAFIRRALVPFARFCVAWRYAVLAAFIGFAIITMSMLQTGVIRFIFFPQVESDQVTIGVNMPVGTPFRITEKTMLDIEEQVRLVQAEVETPDVPVFESVLLRIGETSTPAGPGSGGSSGNGNNLGQMRIQLVPSDFRKQSASDIETMIRERIESFPNIETLEFKSSLVGEEPDIEIELTHPEEEQLNKAAGELKSLISAINGTKEVSDSYEPGKAEYVFELTDQGVAVGLSPFELGRQLRAAFFGLEAQRFQRGRSEVIVYVRYPKDDREDLATLYQTRIRLPDGAQVPLGSVATIKEQVGYSQIQTVNGQRVVSVTGDVDYEVTTPNDVIAQLKDELLPGLKSRYQGLSYSFEGESREQAEDLASLGRNMLIALMLIYVLLGAQLRSYMQPFIIMSAIPFGFIGAAWGHFLLGHDLTFISLFGIVALSGVVVNDSVVLVDYYNKQKQSGETTYDSIILAIERRFRPILLTTLTTSLGLLPILLETSLQAQFLIPMVISLATGIVFSTSVILIMIPMLILIFEDVKGLFRSFKFAGG